ncbi:hypothetical protein [Epilithonimonas sp.]|uniref:hypothetical protein n=1 Tax=Epilithonimonas sp. TaxID=2894511 RepID=UPI002897966B|nr:hypothetical protein [Epilithonimonas sp.]
MKKIISTALVLIITIAQAQLYTPWGLVSTSTTANIGIGIPNPVSKLDIGTDNTQKTFINYQNRSSVTFIPNSGSWFHISTTNGISNDLTISHGGSVDENRLLTIRNTGNVGIGVSDPSAKLDVLETIALSAMNYQAGNRIDKKWMFATAGDITNMFLVPRKADDSGWDWPKQIVFNDGNIAASGRMEAKEVKVSQSPTADFVFEEDYNLPKLEDVEKHIKEKKHLPEIASAKEMERDGVNIGEFQIKLLQKIEELTLYSIEQHKRLNCQSEELKNLRTENETLKQENQQVQSLLERVERLEKTKN